MLPEDNFDKAPHAAESNRGNQPILPQFSNLAGCLGDFGAIKKSPRDWQRADLAVIVKSSDD
tara:strand:- start:184 stop:369 length:186 start_codon:yes stop_codon:yes gene_type:complete